MASIWSDVAVPKSNELPFLIADVTPKALVLIISQAVMSNGVTGIAAIVIGVRNLEKTTQDYRNLLGIEPASTTNKWTTKAKIAVFE